MGSARHAVVCARGSADILHQLRERLGRARRSDHEGNGKITPSHPRSVLRPCGTPPSCRVDKNISENLSVESSESYSSDGCFLDGETATHPTAGPPTELSENAEEFRIADRSTKGNPHGVDGGSGSTEREGGYARRVLRLACRVKRWRDEIRTRTSAGRGAAGFD